MAAVVPHCRVRAGGLRIWDGQAWSRGGISSQLSLAVGPVVLVEVLVAGQ